MMPMMFWNVGTNTPDQNVGIGAAIGVTKQCEHGVALRVRTPGRVMWLIR